MKAEISLRDKIIRVDLSKPIDLSIPISPAGPRAWYVDPMTISPVINSKFTGSVKLGGAVNFRNIFFNPHGHGTHTENIGHITTDAVSINQHVKQFFFIARLITVEPTTTETKDKVITREQLQNIFSPGTEAVIIRTLPNRISKLNANYSDTNFPYFTPGALQFLADNNVQHLLVDLPSVDREEDGGRLEAHRAFWNINGELRYNCTITEFIYVNDEIKDGEYLLNLQFAPFENDASPSRPVIFKIE